MEKDQHAVGRNKRPGIFTTGGFVHTAFGGVLMGIANIIPGVSGGTMILALGLYGRFVESIADVTRLKFRMRSISFLGVLGAAAILAIFALARPIEWGLTHQQHIMFALFIGLTLGGVPLLLREIRPFTPASAGGLACGLAVIISMTFALARVDLQANLVFLFLGGVIGSAAMVLPGVSGSYLLLVLGLYAPIISGIKDFTDALKAADAAAAMGPALNVLLPVGLGVIAGIAGLTNLLRVALNKYHTPTMGCLLGLLLGSVFALYPFKEPGHKDYFEAAAPLNPANIAIVIACIAAGFVLVWALTKLEADAPAGD